MSREGGGTTWKRAGRNWQGETDRTKLARLSRISPLVLLDCQSESISAGKRTGWRLAALLQSRRIFAQQRSFQGWNPCCDSHVSCSSLAHWLAFRQQLRQQRPRHSPTAAEGMAIKPRRAMLRLAADSSATTARITAPAICKPTRIPIHTPTRLETQLKHVRLFHPRPKGRRRPAVRNRLDRRTRPDAAHKAPLMRPRSRPSDAWGRRNRCASISSFSSGSSPARTSRDTNAAFNCGDTIPCLAQRTPTSLLSTAKA